MANLFRPSSGVNKPSGPATSLRVQQSVNGKARTIGWGTTRIAGNHLDYQDFRAIPVAQGGGGGKGIGGGTAGKGSSGATSYNYQAAVVIGLCEGPIQGIGTVWNNKSRLTLAQAEGHAAAPFGYTGTALDLVVFTGGYSQSAWGYMTTLHPTHALNYRGDAYVAAGPMQLGNTPELPNLNFEVQFLIGNALGTPDANPRDALLDALSNPYYGVGFPAGGTNLLLQSQTLDSSTWTKTRSSVAANASVAPNGSVTADKLREDSSASSTHLSSQQVSKAASATQYAASVYALQAERTRVAVQLSDGAGNGAVAGFDLAGGKVAYGPTGVGTPFTGLSAAISQDGQGFYRCSLTATSNTATTVEADVLLDSGAGSAAQSTSYTGDGASGLYVWGAQLEPAASASAYSPTTIFSVAQTARWPADGNSVYANYCLASGLLLSPTISDQRSLADHVKDWLTATNSEAVWSGGLKIVPYGDQAITAGSVQTIAELDTVPIENFDASGNPLGSRLAVGFAGTFVQDLGVVYTSGGVGPLIRVSPPAGYGYPPPAVGQYYLLPRAKGVYIFNYNDAGNGVQVAYQYAAAASYSPPTDPVYAFTDSDFVRGRSGQSQTGAPVSVHRVRVEDANNSVSVEYLDRNNDYNPGIVEAKDDASIQTYGLKKGGVGQLHQFTTASAAQMSASLQLGRQLVRSTYTFTVQGAFILLDPMDVVTIYDSGLGQNIAVRIKEITENDDFTLTIAAEEYLAGASSSPLYGAQPPSGTLPNYNVSPGVVLAPTLFEPTDELAHGLYVYGAVTGADLSVWGGCEVWASWDGVTFAKVGDITGPARVGTLTSTLPNFTPPVQGPALDNTSTLAVDLSISQGQLSSGSQPDNLVFGSLLWVDGELMSYQTVSVTGTYAFNLQTLNRGAYGSTISSHASGARFCRVDQGLFEVPYTQDKVGSTLYLKFLSFNQYGGGKQGLADVGAYTYLIQGTALTSPLPLVQNFVSSFVGSITYLDWDVVDDFRSPIVYEIRKGSTWLSAQFVGVYAHPHVPVIGDDTYLIEARCTPIAGLTVYSSSATSLPLTGTVITALPNNLLASYDEGPSGEQWSGVLSGDVYTDGTSIFTVVGTSPVVTGCVCLLHFNGPNNSTTFIDSVHNHAFTAHGGAKLDTSQFEFGPSSARFNGAADYLTGDGSAEFAFGSSDFTVDFWARPLTVESGPHFLGRFRPVEYVRSANFSGSGALTSLAASSGVLQIAYRAPRTIPPSLSGGSSGVAPAVQVLYDSRPAGTDGLYPTIQISASGALQYLMSGAVQITGTTTVAAGAWHHVALTRASGVTRLFLDGVQQGPSYADANVYLNGASGPAVATSGKSNNTSDFGGWLDELRVVSGSALWTSNFTPPAAPNTSGSGNYLINHIANVQRLAPCLVQFSWSATGQSPSADFFNPGPPDNSDVFAHSDVFDAVSAQYATLTPLLNISTNGSTFNPSVKWVAGVYNMWEAFGSGELASLDPGNVQAVLTAFKFAVYAPTRTDHPIVNGSILGTGTAITFAPDGGASAPFNAGPNAGTTTVSGVTTPTAGSVPSVQVTINGAVINDHVLTSGLSLSGVTLTGKTTADAGKTLTGSVQVWGF